MSETTPQVVIVAPESLQGQLDELSGCLGSIGAERADEGAWAQAVAAVVVCDPYAPVMDGLERHRGALAELEAKGLMGRTTVVTPHSRGGGALLEALEVSEAAQLISWHDRGLWRQVELALRARLARRDALWGVEPWLKPGAPLERREVRSSLQRDGLLAEVADFATAHGANRRVATLAESVADEFIINAVYNAPVDAQGEHRYARRSRTEPVELPEEDAASFTFASDGERLVVSIFDRFGSLAPEIVRSYLLRGLRRGDDQIEHKKGGAGLGLFTVLEAVTRFIVRIEPGQGTEMIGVFEGPSSYRGCLGRPKSLQVNVWADPPRG